MKDRMKRLCPALDEAQCEAFATYYDMLTDWNARMNLTAITEPAEVAEKHFLDSLAAAAYLPAGARCIDVGTGAGFPGVPLLILRDDITVTLLDGLNKRLTFLDALTKALGLSGRVALLHARRGCGQRPCTQGQIRCRPDARGRISACTVGTDGAAAARRRSKHLLQGGCGGGALAFSIGLSPTALQP